VRNGNVAAHRVVQCRCGLVTRFGVLAIAPVVEGDTMCPTKLWSALGRYRRARFGARCCGLLCDLLGKALSGNVGGGTSFCRLEEGGKGIIDCKILLQDSKPDVLRGFAINL
jgi:hypothetical protein